MTQPLQINPALSKPQETPLQAFDRSQRGRRLGKLAVKLQNSTLAPFERDAYRKLAAERRAMVEELAAASDQLAAKNVLRMPRL